MDLGTDARDGVLASTSPGEGEPSADTGVLRFGDYLLEEEIAHGGIRQVEPGRAVPGHNLRRGVRMTITAARRTGSCRNVLSGR